MNGWTLGGVGAAIGIAFTVLLLTCAVAIWLESRWVTFQGNYHQPDPDEFVFTQTPETEAGLAFEEVSFPTTGGATLRGWLVPAAMPTDLAVVAFHGAGGDRRSNMGHLRMLHELGATVLLFDAREHGLSDGSGRGLGLAVREGEDGVAAVDEMRRRGFSKVIGYGCSLGGSTAIVAAAAGALAGWLSNSAQTRLTKRQAPSTPELDHWVSRSGGLSDRTNRRAASTP